MMIEKIQVTAKSSIIENFDTSMRTPRMPSTAYVTGLTNMRGDSHGGRLVMGNKAPERKNIGKIRKLIIN